MRRLAARAALLALSTLLALGLAELAARALGLAPEVGALQVSSPAGEFVSSPDPVLRYVPRPGAADINAHGLRDRERELAKAPGVTRVLLLGDSVAYGFCNERGPLPLSALLNARLEEALGPGFEVLNFGVSGYNAYQEVRLLRVSGLRFEPDVVLVAAVANDNGDASMELEALQALDGWREERALARWGHGRALMRSHLARMLAARWLQLAPHGRPQRSAKLAYTTLATMAREQGFEVRVAMFPDREGRFAPEPHQVMLDAAAHAGFPTLDLQEEMLGREALYAPCSAMHPNARGQRRAAEVIAPWLKEGL